MEMNAKDGTYSFISVHQGWLLALVFFALSLFIGLSFLQSIYLPQWPDGLRLVLALTAAAMGFRIGFPLLKQKVQLRLRVDGFWLRKKNRTWNLDWQEIRHFRVLELNGLTWEIKTEHTLIRLQTNQWFGGEEELREAVDAWQRSFLASQPQHFQAATKKMNPVLLLVLIGCFTGGLTVLVYLAYQQQIAIGASFALGLSLLMSLVVAYRRLK